MTICINSEYFVLTTLESYKQYSWTRLFSVEIRVYCRNGNFVTLCVLIQSLPLQVHFSSSERKQQHWEEEESVSRGADVIYLVMWWNRDRDNSCFVLIKNPFRYNLFCRTEGHLLLRETGFNKQKRFPTLSVCDFVVFFLILGRRTGAEELKEKCGYKQWTAIHDFRLPPELPIFSTNSRGNACYAGYTKISCSDLSTKHSARQVKFSGK